MTRLYSETMHGACRITWPGCPGEQGQVGADKGWHRSLGTQHVSERSSFHLFDERESTEEKLGWEPVKNREGVPEGGPIRQGQVSTFRAKAIKAFQPFIRKCTSSLAKARQWWKSTVNSLGILQPVGRRICTGRAISNQGMEWSDIKWVNGYEQSPSTTSPKSQLGHRNKAGKVLCGTACALTGNTVQEPWLGVGMPVGLRLTTVKPQLLTKLHCM